MDFTPVDDEKLIELRNWATEMKAEGTNDEQELVKLLFWAIDHMTMASNPEICMKTINVASTNRMLAGWAEEMKAEGTEDEQPLVELMFWAIKKIEGEGRNITT
jgi:hypothetical protein